MPLTLIDRSNTATLKIDGVEIPYNSPGPTSGTSTYDFNIGQSYEIEVTYTEPRCKFSRYWGSSNVTFDNKNSAKTRVTVNADSQQIVIYQKFKVEIDFVGAGALTARSVLDSTQVSPDPDRSVDEWVDISGVNAEGYGWFEVISPVINHKPYKLQLTFTPVAPYQFYEWRGYATGTSPTTLADIGGNIYAITSIPIILRQSEGGTISDDAGIVTSDTSRDVTKYYPCGFHNFTATPSPGYTTLYWQSSETTSLYTPPPSPTVTVRYLLDNIIIVPYTTITVTFGPVGVVCFLGDTPILTPSGYKPIRTIQNGDAVTTADGRVVRVCRVLKQRCAPELRVCPYIIPTGMFGALQDIAISPNHEVSILGKGMVKACSLNLERKAMNKPFYYYNLELEDWVNDNLVAAGVECESLAPAERIVLTKEEFMRLVESRYGYSAARRLRTVCFEESNGNVSMPKFRAQ